MNPEKQKSLATHTDEALAMIAEPEHDADIVRFPVERARTIPEAQDEEASLLSQAEEAEPAVAEQVSEKKSKLPLLLATGTTALAGLLMLPRGHDTPAPAPETFTDHVQESAQQPYNPETDELVIDGIRIKPGNANKNTPSEAVLADPEVKAYVAEHPTESSSLTTSALSLPTDASGNYVVVKRDVDHDGDTDAVAVSRS